MSTINRLKSTTPDFDVTLKKLLAFDAEQDDAIESATANILQRVRREGDAALLELTNRFDQVNAPSVAALEIPRSEWEQALTSLPTAQKQALEIAAERVRIYHSHQRQESWSYVENDGTRLGQQITPLDRVGLYVPGGKAAYPSSVLMNAIPAKVAGVSEVIMVTPTPHGQRNAMVLAAAAIAGVDRCFAIGGA